LDVSASLEDLQLEEKTSPSLRVQPRPDADVSKDNHIVEQISNDKEKNKELEVDLLDSGK